MVKKYKTFKRNFKRGYIKKSHIKKLWKAIKSQSPETKYSRASFGTPGTYTSLNHSVPLWLNLNAPIVLGTASGHRIGNKIKNKFIEIRMQLGYVGGQQYQSTVRAVLYIEKAPRGTVTSPFGSTTPWTDSIYDYQDKNMRNFTILYDKTFDLDSNNYAKSLVIKRKLGFNSDHSLGNTGSYLDQDTGALYLLVFTNNQNTGSTAIAYQGHYYLSYQDA